RLNDHSYTPWGQYRPATGCRQPRAPAIPGRRGRRRSAPQAQAARANAERDRTVGSRLAVQVRGQGRGPGDAHTVDAPNRHPGTLEMASPVDRGQPAQKLGAPECADDDEV